MELWVRSQDKTTLIKSYEIYITEQQNKYLIRAKRTSHILGVYNTIERALEVLDEIQEFIENRNKIKITQDINGITSEVEDAKRVYEMPKE